MIVTLALSLAPVWVGRFPEPGPPPAPWRVVRPGGKAPPTRYRVVEVNGVRAIEATADASMALLARPVSIDLNATPVLCWRWLVDAPVKAGDMRRKSGDDYAARVYAAFDIPEKALGTGTKLKLSFARRLYGADVPDAALNYVWDNRNPEGTQANSPYTDRARMIVAQSGASEARRWVKERVDIAADFERSFGGVPGRLVQLAVASDTDQTGGTARAAFADLHFVARGAPCAF